MRAFDSFILIFDYWKNISALLLFIGIFILLYGHFSESAYARKFIKRGLILLGQFFATIILWLSLHFVFETIVRDEIKNFLSQPNLTIKLDDLLADQNQTTELVKEFEKIDWYANRTHQLNRIVMDVSNGKESIQLFLSPDNEDENRYWIFWDKYKATSWKTYNEVGVIVSDLLKKKLGMTTVQRP